MRATESVSCARYSLPERPGMPVLLPLEWEKPDGTAVPSPANVPALGLIRSGEGVGDDLSDDEVGTQVAKDPHDFLGFWDPGNLDAIPWSDLSYDDDSDFTAKRSYHAAAILVFYVDALREKHPDFCNRVHAGWQAHFKRPMSADDLDRIPTVGDNAYTDDEAEVVWCKEIIRYLRGLLDNQGLIDRGLPASDLRRTSRRIPAGAGNAAAAAAAAATAAAPPPGRERRVDDGTPRDSKLELSRSSSISRGRNSGGRSGGHWRRWLRP
jgi:hypothetical protein